MTEYRSECKTCNKSGYLRLRGYDDPIVFVRCPNCGQQARATKMPPASSEPPATGENGGTS